MQKIQWSAKNDPTSWKPEGGSIWFGHPAIARGIIRLLNWFKSLMVSVTK